MNSKENQITYVPLYVEQEKYEKYQVNSFIELVNMFKDELEFMIKDN